ncbi:MAG TPA: preprotein translocase subunit YajC [Frankiaceae bacterium]|nr:preprotein translocase subunit YajC [Frankiaceae bacterium]
MTFTAASSSNSGSLAGLVFPLLLVGLLVLLFLSQRRKSRAVQDIQRQLRPGMNVMTTAGLFAEIQAVDDDQVHLEIAPGVVCRFSRAAVARVLDPPTDQPMGLAEGGFGDGDPDHDIERDIDRGPNDGPPPGAPA